MVASMLSAGLRPLVEDDVIVGFSAGQGDEVVLCDRRVPMADDTRHRARYITFDLGIEIEQLWLAAEAGVAEVDGVAVGIGSEASLRLAGFFFAVGSTGWSPRLTARPMICGPPRAWMAGRLRARARRRRSECGVGEEARGA